MKVAIIGTGYVGLVAGACFADTGNRVTCVDKNNAKIQSLQSGGIPIYEPGLEDLVERGIRAERLFFTSSIEKALQDVDLIFIAVGTPAQADGKPDLSYVESAVREVGQKLNGNAVIVNKSTVPIGTYEKVQKWLSEETRCEFDVVSNPEFLREGSAIEDFLKPDRVVIGATKEAVFEKMRQLYAPFVRQGNPIIEMDPTSAEITKYACNSFLAARISFMNELSQLCESIGGDIEKIRQGMASDFRIGKHFLYPGVGYGGSCFPKDVQALLAKANEAGVSLRIVQGAEEANRVQKKILATKVIHRFGENLSDFTFGVWGLAFKPNTDDMREAPSIEVIRLLRQAGAKIKAYDPVATKTAQDEFGDEIHYAKSAFDAIEDVDALLLVTEWNEFRQIEPKELSNRMKQKIIFDGRNILPHEKLRQANFEVHAIGRALESKPL